MATRYRAKTKLKRNKGQLAMNAAKMNEAEWAQKHDPLFKVKKKERYQLLHKN